MVTRKRVSKFNFDGDKRAVEPLVKLLENKNSDVHD